MAAERDIVAVSIPFSAGVALAAYLPLGPAALHFTAGAALAAALLALALYCRSRESQLPVLPMLLCCGMFCAFSARLSIMPEREMPGLPRRALDAMVNVVDGMGLRGGQSSALIKALVLGQRAGLSRETTQAFTDAGAAHILSLSGLHMGVIYGLLSRSLAWMGRGRAAGIVKAAAGIAAAGFFVLMTGSGPSVVRAFLFILINEISKLFPGRRRRPQAVFWAALMIQLTMNPLIIKSLSFQLSYLAMLAIYTIYPKVEAWYPDSGGRDPMRRLWKSAALTICCQLYTAPLAWVHFHKFPLYFVISNLVALPLSEALIIISVVCVSLEAGGVCPMILKRLSDFLAQALVDVLSVIASL